MIKWLEFLTYSIILLLLSASLKALIGHITQQEKLTLHHHTALATIQSLLKLLCDAEEIPWAELFRTVESVRTTSVLYM